MTQSTPRASAFDQIRLPVGLPRAQAETRIAAALGTESTYTPYGNLSGGTVEYRDAESGAILEVTYAQGAPAPWEVLADGGVVHREPIDETVVSTRIRRE